MTAIEIESWEAWRRNILHRIGVLEEEMKMNTERHDLMINDNATRHEKIEGSIAEFREETNKGLQTVIIEINSFKIKARILWGIVGSIIPLLTGVVLYFIAQGF